MKQWGLLLAGALTLASCAPMMTAQGDATEPVVAVEGTATEAAAGTTDVAAAGAAAGEMTYAELVRQPAAADMTPTGSVRVRNADGQTMTSVILNGLKPDTYYVGHYHVMGTESQEPCMSNGGPILSSAVVGRTDGAGQLMMEGTVATSAISNAAYFNIHTAAEASGAPADAGVVCVPVTTTTQ